MSEVKIIEQFGEEGAKSQAPRKSKWLSCAIEAAILIVALLLGWLVRVAVYETAIVTSGSMQSTLGVGDRLLIDHRQSLRGQWRRGDIILFQTPETWAGDEESLMKRVIGLPDETIELRQGQMFIDGRALRENYLKNTPQTDDMAPLKLGGGKYFVMGDNRDNSDDSRQNGPLPDSAIMGRAVWRLGPLSRLGRLSAPDYGF